MASSELSGPFHLGFEQRQQTIEFLVIFFTIRNRRDKNYPVCQKHYLWGLCLFSACIASGFFFWLREPLGFTRRRSCWLVRYGVVYPGFVRHSSFFSGTWETNGDQSLLVHLYDRAKWVLRPIRRLWRKYSCFAAESSDCGRFKDPYAAFGGNMAALERNQVTVVGLKTHMPPLAEIWLLCSVSSAPVAQMKLHERWRQHLVVFQNRSASSKIVTASIYCDEITNVTDGHVSDESHMYRWSKNSI